MTPVKIGEVVLIHDESRPQGRVLARIFAIGGALCIINDLWVWSTMGVVNYMCVSCNTEKQSKTKVSQRPADFIW